MSALESCPLARPSEGKRALSRSSLRKPLLIADWVGALFVHCEIDAERLQPFVPFELQLWNGRAFVSLVAFTMRGMRFAKFGALGKWICRPIATHEFLNLRTYVRHGDETGICFLSEWLPNRLSIFFGPRLYALPYRHAAIRYFRNATQVRGNVVGRDGSFCYEGELDDTEFAKCEAGSLDEFLIERYTTFNAGYFSKAHSGAVRRIFEVWHEPWLQTRANIHVVEDSLLRNGVPWWLHARLVGTNYSPGVRNVGMSAPRKMRGTCAFRK